MRVKQTQESPFFSIDTEALFERFPLPLQIDSHGVVKQLLVRRLIVVAASGCYLSSNVEESLRLVYPDLTSQCTCENIAQLSNIARPVMIF